MASPHGATSPPAPSSLALPRQRPTLALPTGIPNARRKPSIGSTTSSSHPLRQTSFPPDGGLDRQHQEALLRFSPSAPSPGSFDDFSDSEITSALDGTNNNEGSTRKRKRGEKRGRGGRPPGRGGARATSASLVNGEEGTPASRRGATVENADDGEEEDDDDDNAGAGGGRVPLYEGGQMSAAEYEQDNKRKAMFRQYLDIVDSMPLSAKGREGLAHRDMRERYDMYNLARLRQGEVRKLVNQTLSQSVPQNVVTVVSAYTKTFVGMLVEEARKVQAEWQAVEEKRADGEVRGAYKRLKRTQEEEEIVVPDGNEAENAKAETETNGDVKMEQSASPAQHDTQADDHEEAGIYPGGAGGLSAAIEECDRGPLLPDHLREALRRYKKSMKAGSVGFTGLSLEGRESAASRMGGRKLFR